MKLVRERPVRLVNRLSDQAISRWRQNLPVAAASPSNAEQDINARLVWLLGIPELDDYLSFVKRRVVGGDKIPPRTLVDEWRAANDLMYDLEQAEGGDVDKITTRPLDKPVAALAAELSETPYFKAMFDTMPVKFEMVELDRLIVCQTEIADIYSGSVADTLGPNPSPEALFRFCMSLDRVLPPVRIKRIDAEHYQFVSPSTDLRAHDVALLQPSDLTSANSIGPVAAALGLIVGFTPNFMSVIRSGKRLLLHNGYHRAYALRSLGITHAPCVVETVTRTNELSIIANSNVSSDPGFFFAARRPPLLRDFFNPKLRKELLVRPMETVIEVKFTMSDFTSVEVEG